MNWWANEYTILQPLFIVLLYALVRSFDIAISAICYGIVAFLAMIAVILSLGVY